MTQLLSSEWEKGYCRLRRRLYQELKVGSTDLRAFSKEQRTAHRILQSCQPHNSLGQRTWPDPGPLQEDLCSGAENWDELMLLWERLVLVSERMTEEENLTVDSSTLCPRNMHMFYLVDKVPRFNGRWHTAYVCSCLFKIMNWQLQNKTVWLHSFLNL